jgi:drug/metabolite transporter (DMT)-like permease
VEYVYLLLSIVLLTVGQIAQKLAATKTLSAGINRDALRQLVSCREFCWAVLSLGFGMVLWLIALSTMEVSKAYPMLSLSYVLTVLSARLVLGEHVSGVRWAGVLLISVGAAVVSAA